MDRGTSLPTHLEQFIREQIAVGLYRTKGDVIRAMRVLLDTAGRAEQTGGMQRAEPFLDTMGDAAQTATQKRQTPGKSEADAANWSMSDAPRRSPRGLLADLRSEISAGEISDARSEMWAGLNRGEA